MKVAIVTGVCVPNDAISNTVLQEREVLERAGHSVAVFCQGTTFVDDPGILPGSDPWLMSQHVEYDSADLLLFHFGTSYELFDALLLKGRPGQVRVVRFHNVTPPGLLTGSHRQRAQEGLDQIVITESADAAWCDSEHNRETLVGLGMDPGRASVLALCVPEVADLQVVDGEAYPEPTTILFVGRLVRAKGVLDLMDAFEESGLGEDGCELVITGNVAQSDPDVVTEVRRRCGVGDRTGMSLVPTPTADELAELYARSAVFAIPSYHEGFCVPVVEALARGLQVVASDAGALTEVVADRGRTVPAGDVEALGSALRAAVGDARSGGRVAVDPEWLGQFSPESFEKRFLSAVRALGLPA